MKIQLVTSFILSTLSPAFAQSAGPWIWVDEAKLTAGDSEVGDQFGFLVSSSGTTALIGAPSDHHNGIQSGSTREFEGSGSAPPGQGYCFGDPGSVPGSGCDNGVFASGAQPGVSGSPSISDATLALRTTSAEPHNYGLYFQANNRIDSGNGTVFGDGLRCAGGGLIRLQVTSADAAGGSLTTIAIGVRGEVPAGDTKRYQYWYRTNFDPPCGLFVNNLNLTNAYELTWLP